MDSLAPRTAAGSFRTQRAGTRRRTVPGRQEWIPRSHRGGDRRAGGPPLMARVPFRQWSPSCSDIGRSSRTKARRMSQQSPAGSQTDLLTLALRSPRRWLSEPSQSNSTCTRSLGRVRTELLPTAPVHSLPRPTLTPASLILLRPSEDLNHPLPGAGLGDPVARLELPVLTDGDADQPRRAANPESLAPPIALHHRGVRGERRHGRSVPGRAHLRWPQSPGS